MAEKKAKDKVDPKPKDEPKEVKKEEPKEEPKKERVLPFVIKGGATAKHHWLNMMCYADYGVGKTEFCGTATEVPGMRDVLMIDVEAGDLTLRDKINEGLIDTISITNFKTFARVHEFLRLHCRFRDEDNTEELIRLEAGLKQIPESEIKTPRKYKTVIIDSLTEVQKLCMYNLLGVNVGEHKLDIAPIPEGENLPWMSAQEMMRLLIRTFRNLPMHCLMTCSVIMEQDKQKEYHYKPMLPGKLSHESQGFLDVVGFLVAKTMTDDEGNDLVKRRMLLQPSDKWSAKDRYHKGNTIAYIDNPTLTKFLQAKPEDDQ